MLKWLKSLFGGENKEETTEAPVAEPQEKTSTEEVPTPEAQTEEEQIQ